MIVAVILVASLLWLLAVRSAFRPAPLGVGGAPSLRAGARWWILGAVLIPTLAFAACLIATLPPT